jgi:hypothetical protein
MHLDTPSNEHLESIDPVFAALRTILAEYLASKPHMSINSFSKRCKVSEPTLRRIHKGQLKTLPNITTTLDILTTISGKTSASEIAKQYPGPIADFLYKVVPQIEDCQTVYDIDLNEELTNSTKYILYKLSSNYLGVTEETAKELCGTQGLDALKSLLTKKLIKKMENSYFSNVRNFTVNKGNFVENIKTLAQFIKIRFSVTQPLLNPLLANYSESISIDAYKEIVQIQNKALENIRKITSNKDNAGPLPVFLFVALDTISNQTAFEIAETVKN